jgi:hypothetical protein
MAGASMPWPRWRFNTARRLRIRAGYAEFGKPVTTPLVAGREMARAIGPKIAIVDEAPATLGALRAFLSTESTRQYSFWRGGHSAGVCRRLLARHRPRAGGLDRRRWRSAVLTAGAVDRGSRTTSCNICRDQQPGIQDRINEALRKIIGK